MAMSPQKSNPVPLILFIVLFVASTVALVLVSMEAADRGRIIYAGVDPASPAAREYARPNEEGLIAQMQERENRIRQLISDQNRLLRTVGKIRIDDVERRLAALEQEMLEGVSAVDLTTEQRRELLREARGVIEEEVSIDRFRRNLSDLVNNEILVAQKAEGSVTLMGLITRLEIENQNLRDRHNRELSRKERQVAELDAEKNSLDQRIAQLQQQVRDKDSEIENVRSQSAQQLREKDAEVERVVSEIRRERESFRNDLEEAQERRQAAEQENRRLREQIRIFQEELAARRPTVTRAPTDEPEDTDQPAAVDVATHEEPAGTVILVDEVAGIMVDIGHREGVRRNLKFDIFRQRPDGTREKRGTLIIKSVFEQISRGVLEEGINPVGVVATDDIIINPAFDPGRKRVFVADTTFTDPERETLRELLAEYGSVLEDEVTPQTDYLIVGRRRGGKVEEAEMWNIPLIRQEDLRRFLERG